MKIGVKTYFDINFLKHFKDKVDFFEIQAIQKNDYSFLEKFSKPIIIHAEHQGWGINISNGNKKELNLRSINFARQVAGLVNAKKIIIHPSATNENGSINNVINFLKEIGDNRILVENLSGNRIGSSPEDISKIIKEAKVGFCFDVNHAINYSLETKKDIFEVIKEFLKLKPKHFYVGGQRLISGKGLHLSLREFDWDWKDILSLYPRDAEITLETTTDTTKVDEDIILIRKILNDIDNSD